MNNIKQKTCAMLDRHGTGYAKLEHEAAPTIEACAEIERELGVLICKNLFLCNRQQTDFYLLLMPGDKPFKTKDLSKQLGVARLSFASGEQMQELLCTAPGSLSVLSLAYDTQNRVQLVIDREIAQNEALGCHPCDNTASLNVKMQDILNVFLPEVHHTPAFVELKRE